MAFVVDAENAAKEIEFMSVVNQGEDAGIRDPYRTLLILLWGTLMALAAFAGQVGGREDFKVPAGQSLTESRAHLEGGRVSEDKRNRPAAPWGY